jgi:trk system potassium uptake protein TrkA
MYLEKIKIEGNRKRVLVLGLGSFGWTIATSLAQNGHEVFAADKDEKIIKKINEFVSKTILLDQIDEHILKEIGVNHFDICIVAELVNCQVSNYSAITMKQLGCSYVMATVESDTDVKLLKKFGIDKIVNPAQEMASRLAYSLTTTDIIDYIELSGDYQIVELIAPQNGSIKAKRN